MHIGWNKKWKWLTQERKIGLEEGRLFTQRRGNTLSNKCAPFNTSTKKGEVSLTHKTPGGMMKTCFRRRWRPQAGFGFKDQTAARESPPLCLWRLSQGRGWFQHQQQRQKRSLYLHNAPTVLPLFLLLLFTEISPTDASQRDTDRHIPVYSWLYSM